ncbi:MAG: N-formylglutamate deformylase, partial [Burkholderiaceae bacterium]
KPERNVHAIQLEMTQSSYMQEALPFDYLPERANAVQSVLQRMVNAAYEHALAAASRA